MIIGKLLVTIACRICDGTGPTSVGSPLCNDHEIDFQTWLKEKKMNEQKATDAPRVTIGWIEGEIRSEHYFTAADGSHWCAKDDDGADDCPPQLSLITFCVLIMRTGATITGESTVASKENFNAQRGREAARSRAIAKAWELEGYRLAASVKGTVR